MRLDQRAEPFQWGGMREKSGQETMTAQACTHTFFL